MSASEKSPFQNGTDTDEDLGDFEAASRVGFKVIDMAERVKTMHAIVPGSQAVWNFTIDDTRFNVVVTVAPEQEGTTR